MRRIAIATALLLLAAGCSKTEKPAGEKAAKEPASTKNSSKERTGPSQSYLGQARDVGQSAASKGNLHQMGVVLIQYALTHDEAFPESLEALVEAHLLDPAMLKPAQGRGRYVYVPGLKASSGDGKVLTYESLDTNGGTGGNVLFVGGQVEWKTADQLTELLGRQGLTPAQN